MKYIRTEDRIYELEKLNLRKTISNIKFEIRDNKLFKIMFGYEEHIYEYPILKQADTIEELCDEAVAIYPDGTHDNCSVMHIVDNNGFCEAVYGCLSVSVDDLKKDYECWEVYGAIWCSKGLIYVAKMNDEGELVLI